MLRILYTLTLCVGRGAFQKNQRGDLIVPHKYSDVCERVVERADTEDEEGKRTGGSAYMLCIDMVGTL